MNGRHVLLQAVLRGPPPMHHSRARDSRVREVEDCQLGQSIQMDHPVSVMRQNKGGHSALKDMMGSTALG
jgi:hypothetical protein